MSLQVVVCPHCNEQLFTDGSAAGREVPCPGCSTTLVLPGQRAPSASVKDEQAGIEYELDGQHPVQANGRVHGHRFYFRAKWDAWSFTLCMTGCDPSGLVTPEQRGYFSDGEDEGFYLEESFGSETDASYMTPAQAEAIIRACASVFERAQARRRS